MHVTETSSITAEGWVCGKCDAVLERALVPITYMGSSFEEELPRCPQCGFTYIPEELAQGKMLEVERILEDK